MAALDHLFVIFLQAKEKCNNKCDEWEEDFLWLEEVVDVAKRSFAHADQTLLPKTPAIKKRGRPKRTDASPVLEDAESPSKRASIESTISHVEVQSPDCPPPRKGRAAARLAQEKVAKSYKEHANRKLRRPSTPEEPRRTTRKTKPTKTVEYARDSVEIISCDTEDHEENIAESAEPVKLETAKISQDISISAQSDTSDRLEIVLENTPKKLDTTYRRSSSVGKKLKYPSQEENPPTEKQESQEEVDSITNEQTKSTATESESSRIDSTEESDDCIFANDESKKKLSASRVRTSKNDSGIGEVRNEKRSKSKSTTKIPDTYQKVHSDDTDDIFEVVGISKDSGFSAEKEGSSLSNSDVAGTSSPIEKPEAKDEKIDKSTLPDPVPKVRSTRTKQKEIIPLSSLSECNDIPKSVNSPVPKPRTTRTKQRAESQTDSCIVENKSEVAVPASPSKPEAILEEETNSRTADLLPPPEIPKARSTRTKKKQQQDFAVPESLELQKLNIRINNHLMSEASASDSESAIDGDDSQCSTDSFLPPETPPKARSTRTKKKQVVEAVISDGSGSEAPKPRSTRTKKKMDEEKVESASEDGHSHSQSDVEKGSDITVLPSRSTRTKKRQVEEQANQPSRSTRTKRRKVDEDENEGDKENSHVSDSGVELKSISSPESKALSLIKKYQVSTEISSLKNKEKSDSVLTESKPTNKRITRSKVRQVPATKASPKNESPYTTKSYTPVTKADFQRDCCSPMSDKGTPKNRQMGSRVDSPLRNSPRLGNSNKTGRPGYGARAPFQKGDVLTEVEEISSNDIEVTTGSPARITRHSGGKPVKTPDARWARINPQPRTPSPQCPSGKVVRPKMGHMLNSNSSYGSSGRITPKTYSRIRPGLMNSASASSSSTEYHKTERKIHTPNEAKRTKNIITGVSSFIKVQAPKPTREELEGKKHLELQKKKEREEETRKKKEDMLKLKVEDQKRRNEERMRRAKEAREENERKAEAAKDLQKRQREERLKEEQQKKKQMLAKKLAEEEAKTRKIKEQLEEERRRQEEIRLAEEARKAEEARRLEEERKAEQQRLQEEKRKRIAEVERIARERKELEQLKIREAERLASAKKLNGIAVPKLLAHNSTFTKDPNDNKENSSNLNTTYTANHNATFTKNSDGNQKRGDSYEMTPDKKNKKKPTNQKGVNNYNINDLLSDDSTDDEAAPKKNIPTWAQGTQLKAALINQEYYPPDIITIFTPEELLVMPDLTQMFPVVRRRFFKRTSSAIWTTPPSKLGN